jgi:hypothetical protein
MSMQVQNLSDLAHGKNTQEFPTVYSTYGYGGTANLNVVLDSNGNPVTDQAAAFESPGGWAASTNQDKSFGIGIYYENRITHFQTYRRENVFNNIRSLIEFGIGAHAIVEARAYLIVGSFAEIADRAAELDRSIPPFGSLDVPQADAKGGDTLAVAGWALDNKGVARVEALVDGASVADLTLDQPRPDVCLQYPGYAGCDHAGFSGTLPWSDKAACAHLIEVRATDTDGNSRVIANARVLSR